MQCREPHSRAQVPSGLTSQLPTKADGDAVWDLVARCRDALNVAGIHQWDALYPARSMIDADLQAGRVIGLSASTRWLAIVSVWSEPESEYAAIPWMTSGPVRIVHRLCVDPALWRSGYANVLMDIVERRAAEEGAASIRLDAYSENPAALTLYRRRGYREAGCVWFPRRRAPFVCLEKDLSTSEAHPGTDQVLLRRARVRDVFGQGIGDHACDELYEAYRRAQERRWKLFDDVLPCLDALETVAIGIVSNGEGSQQRAKLLRTGIAERFRCALVSAEVGVSKPDALIFVKACHALGRDPGNVFYI